MGKSQSRLSFLTDSRKEERKAASPRSSAKDRCPSCSLWRLITVDVDGDLPISICDGCNHWYGVDDSMNSETLAMLLVDELGGDVQMTVVTCDQCFNADVDRFKTVGIDSDPLVLHVQCEECFSITDIPLEDWVDDGSKNCDEAFITEMLSDTDDRNEDVGGAMWRDSESGYFVDYNDAEGCVDTVPGIDVLPFSCCCGNYEADCFQLDFHPASESLSMVKCLNCDRVKILEEFFGIECGYCGNDNKELFERLFDDYGRLTYLRCFQCDKRLHAPGDYLDEISFIGQQSSRVERQIPQVQGRTEIADLRDIRRGDHIAWHRWYAVWHHAIVVDVPDGGRTLKVIHYNGDIVKVEGHLASVREETLDFNPGKDDLYRIDYPVADVYPVEKVIERARSRLGEAKYKPLRNNCEHFARWCKTGRAECGQVRTFKERLGVACQTAATKVTQEATADVIESVVAKPLNALSRVAIRGIRQRAGQVFGATPGIVRKVKCGALACNIAVNLLTESAIFIKDALAEYHRYKSGAISCDELRRQLGKHGCESVGGLVSGVGVGILGQVLIPVPFVGGLVGSTLGNLIGRYVGAIIGKQIAAKDVVKKEDMGACLP